MKGVLPSIKEILGISGVKNDADALEFAEVYLMTEMSGKDSKDKQKFALSVGNKMSLTDVFSKFHTETILKDIFIEQSWYNYWLAKQLLTTSIPQGVLRNKLIKRVNELERLYKDHNKQE